MTAYRVLRYLSALLLAGAEACRGCGDGEDVAIEAAVISASERSAELSSVLPDCHDRQTNNGQREIDHTLDVV